MTIITEDYVSFELAKLLKEKGFDGRCRAHYGTAGSFCYKRFEVEAYEMHNAILAPTIQMTMKWLREVHNIDIIAPPQYDGVKWTYSAIIFKLSIPCTEIRLNDNKNKKEESIEAAIKYCLEYLI